MKTAERVGTNGVAGQYYTIGQAALCLGISVDTLRRWEKAGKVTAHRLDGKNRYFAIADVETLKNTKPLTTLEVAKLLGVSASTVRRLEQAGGLTPERNDKGARLYSQKSVALYKERHQPAVMEPTTPKHEPIALPEPSDELPFEAQFDFESEDHSLSTATPYKVRRPKDRVGILASLTLAIFMLFVGIFTSISPGKDLSSQLSRAAAAVGQGTREPSADTYKSASNLVLPANWVVNLGDTGLSINISQNNLVPQNATVATTRNFESRPVQATEIADSSISGSKIAPGGITFDNLAPELQVLINSMSKANVGTPTTNVYTTNVYQTPSEPTLTTVNGVGLTGNISGQTLSLNVNTGTSTELVGNNLEVKLSGNVTTTTDSPSGLERTAQGLQLLGGCGTNQVLQWMGSSWSCATVMTGSSNLAVQDGGATVSSNASAINFTGNEFVVTNNAGQATVAIDYAGSGLARVGANQAVTGNWSFKDSGFTVADDTDATKRANFELSGITSGTTRTLTVPDTNGTLITSGNLQGITAVGTVTSGTWQGSTVGVQYGGTGATSFTNGGILYGNGTGALQATAAGTGGQLLVAGTGGQPAFVSLSGDATLSSLGALTLAASGTTTGTFGDGTHVPTITVDAKGRITGVTSTLITGAAPTGTASGDLTGNYPGPTIGKLQGNTLTIGSVSGGQILQYNGTAFVNQTLSGDITLSSTGVATIGAGKVTNANLANSALTVTAGTGLTGGGSAALGGGTSLAVAYGSAAGTAVQGNTTLSVTAGTGLTGGGTVTLGSGGTTTVGLANTAVTAATYGGSSAVPTFTVDAQGRLTAAGTTTLANAALQNATITVTAGTGLTGGGATALGSSTSLAVTYGSTAGTAVQGNTSVICPSGSGNLTGGGTTITLGSGGTCGSLSTTNNPTFSTSVTTPSLTNAGNLSIATTAGGNLTLNSAGQIILTGFNCSTYDNGGVLTTNASGVLSCQNDDGGMAGTITGSGTVGRLAVYNGTGSLGNATLAQNASTLELDSGNSLKLLGGNLSVTGNMTVTGTTTLSGLGAGLLQSSAGGVVSSAVLDRNSSTLLSGTLSVANGGSGATSFTSNGIVFGNGSGALQATSAGTSGQVLVAGTGGTPAFVTVSGDVTLSNTGVATIGAGKVGNSQLTNSSLTVTAGTGLTGGGSTALGGSTSLAVAYGSTSGTAAQGNTALSFTGSGNLTGSLSGTAGGGFTTTSLALVSAPTFTGKVTAVGLDAGTGAITGTGGINVSGGLTVSGATTLSTLNSAGFVRTNASGVLSTGALTNGDLANSSLTVSAGTGLTGGGSVALGSSTSLAVAYGSTAGSAVQGNTTLVCSGGTGNLSGGGTTITLGSGGTCGNLSISNSPTFSGTLAVQGAGGITVGTAGSVAGTVSLANASSTRLVTLQGLNPSGTGNATVQFPTIAGGSTDTVCLQTLANCGGGNIGGSGTANYVARFTGSSALGTGLLYDNASAVYVGATSGGGLFNVGTTNQFQVSSTGAVTAVGINAGAGLIQGTGGLTSAGMTTLSALGAGVVRANASGVLSSSALTNSDLANSSLTVSAGTGLTGGGSVALGGSTSLAVAYGSTSGTAAQGNTALTFNGSGNLTGSLSGTAGGGFTTTTLGLVNNPTFTGAVTAVGLNAGSGLIQGTGGLTVSGAVNNSYTSAVTGNAQATSVTNNNASATTATINAHNIALTGGANSNAGANIVNGVNFAAVTPVTNNTFNGLNFGTGYSSLLSYNGTPIVSGSGILQSAGLSGTYGNAVTFNNASNSFTGNGAGLTNIAGANIAAGSIANSALANSSLTVTAGTGLTGGGSTALGGSTSLAVSYGSTAGSAVQGNTTLVCPSGSGNLSGGGNTITLGTGGTCNSLNISNTPTFTGLVTSAGLNAGTGLIQGTGGLTIGGTTTLSGLNSAGFVRTNASGVLSTGALTNSDLANSSLTVSAGTGLTGGGSVALGSSTSLAVAYGSTSGTAAQGNTALSFTGSGNLTGSVTGTAGGGFSSNTLALVNSPTFSGTLAVQGASTTIGTSSQQGSLVLNSGNATTGTLRAISTLGQNTVYTLPDPGASGAATICLSTGNCAGSGGGVTTAGGTANYLARFTGSGTIGNGITYDNGSAVSIGGSSPAGLFSVGSTNQFQVSSTGTVTAVGVNGGAGLIQGTGGLTIGGTTTLSSLNTAGIVHTNASGVLSTGAVALGSETTGNYVASLGSLTGLTTSGNTGAGATPSLSVSYGSTSTTAVRGDTTLVCPSGTGNLSGGGNTITLGTGGTCSSLSIASNPSFSGLTVSGSVSNSYSSGVTGTAQSTTATNTNASATASTVSGHTISLVGNTNANASANTLNGVSFANVTPITNNTFNALNFGTGYNSLLSYNGTPLVSGTGILQSAALSGTYSNALTLSNASNVLAGNGSAITSLSGGNITVGSIANSALANSSITITAGTGLTGGGATALGGSASLAVAYGSAAGTAVQGNTTLTCASGSGNLSGGGNTITLGTGGTCSAISLSSTPTFSGKITGVGVDAGTGQIQGTGGLSVSGAVTLGSLNTAGVLHTNASGVVSTGAVALGSETTGNYVATLGTLTGLTTSGNTGAGSTPTLSVAYGSTANTAAQGNTALTFNGAGNLTGSLSGTAGGGFTTTTLDVVNNPSFSGQITGSNSGTGLALSGAPSATATTSLLQVGGAISGGNSAANGGTYIGLNAPSTGAGSAADYLNFQTNGTTNLQVTSLGYLNAPRLNGTTGIYTGTANSGFGTQRIDANGNFTGNRLTIFNASTPVTDIAAFLSGTPVATTGAHAFLMIGSGFSNTNNVTNGGTYFGLNAPTTGLGSAADFLNFQSGASSKFKIDNTGAVTAAGVITLSNLNSAGFVRTNASGVLSTGALSNSDLANSNVTVTAGTGLTGGGSVALGGSTTLAVGYGSTASTAVQGNTTLVCPTGSGNLTGGGTTITLGAGGTCAGLTMVSAPTFAGKVTSVGLDAGSGLITGTGGLTIGGTTTLSSLNSAGFVRTSSTGALSTGALSNSDLANSSLTITAGTGLTGGGLTALGGSTSLAVTYGSAAGSAVQGNTTLVCPTGSGNLTGGGNTITLGSGGTCGALSMFGNPTFSGQITGSSSGTGLAITGVPTNTATTSLIQVGSPIAGGNTTTNGGTYIGLNAPSTGAGSAADFLNFQSNGSIRMSVTNAGTLTVAGTLTGVGVNAGSGSLQGTGGLSITGNSSITGTLSSLTGVTSTGTVSGTNVTATGTLLSNGGINTGAGSGTQRIDASGNLVNIGTADINGLASLDAGLTSTGTALFQNSSSLALLTADATNTKIQVGAETSDANQVNLQLDSYNAYTDSGACTTTSNQGAMYYNTATNAIRSCINGGWEDLISTAALGLQLFGVVPDSGATSPGDIAGVTGTANGPCKVSVGASTTQVAWKNCTAYSNGRKIIVAAGSLNTSNATAGNFQHLCLTGTNGQPALTASGAEAANLATVSMPSVMTPILCLADIKFSAANSTITTIYDTRTFTTSTKMTGSVNAAAVLGGIYVATTTRGSYGTTTTAGASGISGVVVATTGSASTTTVNAIIAVGGQSWVKAVSGTSNAASNFVTTSATASYATTATAKATESTTTVFNVLGLAQTPWTGSTACAANLDSCQGSILTSIDRR